MIKLISTILFICFTFVLVNCKSDHPTETQKAKTSQETADSLAMAKELNKYLILPPDSDYTGDYIDKYPSGVIKFSGYFRFGKRHGQWMAFYENGEKWSECFYDNGKRHGSSIVYFENGQTKYTGWFKNDLRDSIWVFFDDKGKEIDKRAYRNDEETGLVN